MNGILDAETMKEYLRLFIEIALLPGFGMGTMLHFIGYGIFKGLSLLNIRS